jgi:hypothetical protein
MRRCWIGFLVSFVSVNNFVAFYFPWRKNLCSILNSTKIRGASVVLSTPYPLRSPENSPQLIT